MSPPTVPVYKRPIVVITVAVIVIMTIWRVAALKKKSPEPAAPAQTTQAPAQVPAPPAEAPPAPPAPVKAAAPTQAPIKRDRTAADKLRADIARARAQRTAQAPRPAPAGSASATADKDVEPGLSRDYIREQVRVILPLLEECYTQALERDPKLGGRIVVKFEIAGEPELGGAVESSEIQKDDSTANEAEFQECVQETMYAAQFKPPTDGGTISVSYPFEFRAAE